MVKSVIAITSALYLLLSVPVEAGQPAWEELKPQQKEALAPLAQEWNGMGPAKKKKWLGIAKRYPHMTPEDQHRQGRHPRCGEAGGGVLPSQLPQEVNGGGVQAVGEALERFGGLTACRRHEIFSLANELMISRFANAGKR